MTSKLVNDRVEQKFCPCCSRLRPHFVSFFTTCLNCGTVFYDGEIYYIEGAKTFTLNHDYLPVNDVPFINPGPCIATSEVGST